MRRWADNWRIIPARAGSTMPFANAHAQNWDHPRSRGEHRYSWRSCCPHLGSSPLARGARIGGDYRRLGRGIIPARAGSTVCGWTEEGDHEDHPRSRGEHSANAACCGTTPGSSPLARGARRRRVLRLTNAGIIPARAGSTSGTSRNCRSRWDHPRSRGEHVLYFLLLSLGLGSSPLARGAPGSPYRCVGACRIIPARAGSTFSRLGTS